MKASNLSHQEIAQQAYQIYVRNGCKHGHAEEHWLQAEAELRNMMSGSDGKTATAAPKVAASKVPAPKAAAAKPAASNGSTKSQPVAVKAGAAGKKPKSSR